MRAAFLALCLALAACKTPASSALKDADDSTDTDSAEAAHGKTAQLLSQAGATLCPGKTGSQQSFHCVKLAEPLDHFGGASKTVNVTFAVHYAAKQPPQGLLINIDGGPGYSGVADADNYKSTDQAITDAYDIVWFDLRGVGLSGNLQCKKAAAAFYLGGLRATSADDEAALTQKAQAFATACPAEIVADAGGAVDLADLPFYNTRQAAEDLDGLRKLLGYDKLTIYGLSYGTQLAQTYVRFHPEHVAAFVIDGVVNLSLDHMGFMQALASGNLALLDLTLNTCAQTPDCAAPFGSQAPRDAYAQVAAALAGQPPLALTATPGLGTLSAPRYFGRKDLDTTTFNSLGHADTRRDLMRALAAAAGGNYGALLDVAYAAAGIDPQTAGPVLTQGADPDMSDAVYYTVTCNDYGKESLSTYLATGRALAQTDDRLLSPFYGDIPCAFWPTGPHQPAQPALKAAGIPAVVVNASGDAQTPFQMGRDVAAGLDRGHTVTYSGGHHVMYGSGNACGDAPITGFLEGTEPPAATVCDDVIIGSDDGD